MANQRFEELDILRGIAIIFMIIYHFIFDLNYIFNSNINLNSLYFEVFQEIIPIMFLLLVGISFYISTNKKNAKITKYLKNGGIILLYGLIISIVTYFIFKDQFVRIGILHLIGISIILAYFFRRLRLTNLIVGIIIIIIGYILKTLYFHNNNFLLFGLRSATFQSVDYYPLIPWFGFVLIGIFLGHKLYTKGERQFKMDIELDGKISNSLSYLGRKSLLIYMLHQPILFCLLYLLRYFIISF